MRRVLYPTSMDGNDTVLLTDNLSINDSSITVFFGRAHFTSRHLLDNERGATLGTWKRVGATVLSYPIDGVVETGDGWSTSEWFGEFGYFENGHIYHYGLVWVYLSSDEEDGIWLWRKEHGWLWSKDRNLAIPLESCHMATGSTCSFVRNRTQSSLIIKTRSISS